MSNLEIERKWLMEGFPPLQAESEQWMEQGYLAFEPATVRIRYAKGPGGSSRMLTIKGRGTIARTEVELPLDEAQYAALVPLMLAPPAKKLLRTYRLPGGHCLECSLVDEGEPDSFYYAEVEFASLEEANAFEPPAFLGREVTEQPGFTMAAYCRRKARACAPPPANGE